MKSDFPNVPPRPRFSSSALPTRAREPKHPTGEPASYTCEDVYHFCLILCFLLGYFQASVNSAFPSDPRITLCLSVVPSRGGENQTNKNNHDDDNGNYNKP